MPMSMQEIEKSLETLRLSGMRATLETRVIHHLLSWKSFHACSRKLDHRRSRLIERRFNASGLLERKTLTEFDWGFNPRLPKKEIFELVTIKFIHR